MLVLLTYNDLVDLVGVVCCLLLGVVCLTAGLVDEPLSS